MKESPEEFISGSQVEKHQDEGHRRDEW